MRGIGPAEYHGATHDVTLQPEFIRLHVLTKILQNIREKYRWEDLLAEFEVCDCDVGFFSETWRAKRQECFEMSSGARLFLSGGGSRQRVGIGISARLWRLIEDVSFHACSSRVCLSNCSIRALKFPILSVYFPTSWDDDSEIQKMYEIWQLMLNNIHCSGVRIVIGGDFIPLPIEQVGLCTPFCSIKWVPTTKWVCTPQLLVSTKWLHTPSDVLMLNVLLEWVCNPFCRKWVYRHVGSPTWSLQNGLY